nr:hypothetical protein BaRGS_013115 [Batillaria attramentaria]
MGYDVFVTHLSVSDFLMGMYLVVIGVADRLYQGNYQWKDTAWKNSTTCASAGFLSLLSNEVSAFVICLITMERVSVIRFPFTGFRFGKRSAHLACVVVWIVGVFLAAVPALPVTSHWRFYGQTGICVPLPIPRNDFQGHDYSFGVMIVLNFVLFMLIAVGQILIYWSIQTNSMSTADSTRRSRDMTIARRLFAVVMSDFLCWFPVGLLGILAATGAEIPGEVNVAVAIFVLPFNSALNPFVYTYTVIMEKRRVRQEEQLKQRLIQEIKLKQNNLLCK